MTIPPPRPTHRPGEVLVERFAVLEVIGRGGHGVVYRAMDEKVGRLVAIKFLHPEFQSDTEYNVRMVREAQAAGRLTGSASVKVYELRANEHGALFMVMELL